MKTLFIAVTIIASSSFFAQSSTLTDPIFSGSNSSNKWILTTPVSTAPGDLHIAPKNQQGAWDFSKQTIFFSNGCLGLGPVSVPFQNDDKILIAGNINAIQGSDINTKIGFALQDTFKNPLNGNTNPLLTIANYGMTRNDNTLSVSGYEGVNFFTNMKSQMRILNTGEVLIGRNSLPTAFPNYKLYVQGGILATEVRVSLGSNWPDYVFNKDHKLTPLDEVEKYINENGHLSNTPSASTIKEEGINVSEMIRIQQEKIEELTLYIIEQNKRIKALESKSNSN